MSTLNPGLAVSVHCYQGDVSQVRMFLPLYEHHQAPVIILSPEDSPVVGIGPHHCYYEGCGQVGYTGHHTWTRQKKQMQRLLALPQEFQLFLMNDADSFCLSPKLPKYLYEDDNTLWSNLVDDFRVPGTFSHGVHWPHDYHAGMPQKAAQPPYVLHRKAMQKIVDAIDKVPLCPICPFIDWIMVAAPHIAGVKLARFHSCLSINTKTPEEISALEYSIVNRGATFIHSIKDKAGFVACKTAYAARIGTHPDER